MNSEMIDYLARKIATLCGLGEKTKFPGTLASFVALIFSFLSYYFFGKITYTILFFVFLTLGLWVIDKIHKEKEQKDYSWIVIDEWIGIWLVGFFLFELGSVLDSTLFFKIGIALLGFIIFRIIDIFKFIPPIKIIDKKEPQTAGLVIMDDCVAGCYTYAIMMILFGFYNLNYLYIIFLIILTPMLANMTPVLLRRIKILEKPVHTELFGKNKTWRGFIGGIIVGTLFYCILDTNAIIAIGFLFSLGALMGDLIKSYLKRKLGIREGESWIPFDQIDYILGAIILTYPVYYYSLRQIILMLIVGGAMSALAHRGAYVMKMINTKQ